MQEFLAREQFRQELPEALELAGGLQVEQAALLSHSLHGFEYSVD
jgi:hypothetical protein